MINPPRRYSRPLRFRISTMLFVTGLVATTACATDPIGPESRLAPKTPSLSILSNEDLVPNQDWSNPGSWSSSPLWSNMDEATPNDDTDYISRIRIGLPPTNSVAIVNLSDPVGTPSPSQVHTLKVRWKVIGNYSTTTPQPTLLSFRLLAGGGTGTIAASAAVPSSSYVTTSYTLIQSEVNSITNYNDLQLYLEAQLKPATGSNQIEARVTWARLEIR